MSEYNKCFVISAEAESFSFRSDPQVPLTVKDTRQEKRCSSLQLPLEAAKEQLLKWHRLGYFNTFISE